MSKLFLLILFDFSFKTDFLRNIFLGTFGNVDISVIMRSICLCNGIVSTQRKREPAFLSQLSSTIKGLFYCGYLPCFLVKLRCGLAVHALNTCKFSPAMLLWERNGAVFSVANLRDAENEASVIIWLRPVRCFLVRCNHRFAFGLCLTLRVATKGLWVWLQATGLYICIIWYSFEVSTPYINLITILDKL